MAEHVTAPSAQTEARRTMIDSGTTPPNPPAGNGDSSSCAGPSRERVDVDALTMRMLDVERRLNEAEAALRKGWAALARAEAIADRHDEQAESRQRVASYVQSAGEVTARPIKCTDLDPYIDECPSWCVDNPHRMQWCDEDRNHYGELFEVPVRSIRPFLDPVTDSYCPETVELYLHRNTTLRNASVYLGLSEDPRRFFELTVREAEIIGRRLLEIVEAAR